MTTTPPIDPDVQIGHVHLKVSDLDRSLTFYRVALGFTMTGRLGDAVAFLAAGDYHHHIALNTIESRGGSPPPAGSTGLYHFALRYPTRLALARALRRVLDHDVQLTGASEHGASESVYIADPDGNGIELSYDRPPDQWPRTADGRLAPINLPLDVESLLALLEDDHAPR